MKNIKKYRLLLMVFLTAVFLFSLGMEIRRQLQYQESISDTLEAKQISGLQNASMSTKPSKPALETTGGADWQNSRIPGKEEASGQQEALPEEASALANINLETLRTVNPDVIGWIMIPDTEISYPLLQGEDNKYYLSHNWKRKSSGSGSIFLESTNSRDLTDFHTIVYAHRMRNDTMFGELKYYRESDFWQEHPYVYLATDGGVSCYEIFAVQTADAKGIVYRLDIKQSSLEEEFLQSCIDNSVIDTGITPGKEDHILTLSTCTSVGYSNRLAVHSRLTQIYNAEFQ